MSYAADRRCYDADSHLMELSDWLVAHADPGVREKIRPLHLGGAGKLAANAVSEAERRRNDPEAAWALEANVMGPKGWSALGAFDPKERSRALDLLGFEKQLVFSTFAATQFMGGDLDLLYGGTRAHNRAMAAFCEEDPRLIGVGMVPWADPNRTRAEAQEAVRLGCGAILVPSHPGKGLSPTHPEYEGFWAFLQEAGVPFMTHIGGGGRPLPRAFPRQGLHGAPQLARGLPLLPRARWRAREVPAPSRGMHRAGGDVGGPVAQAPRHCTGHVPEDRAVTAACPQSLRLRATPAQVHSVPHGASGLDDRAGR
jgi:hypothetical protein